jgi:uncharacterized membrane protein (UPF0127 family)
MRRSVIALALALCAACTPTQDAPKPAAPAAPAAPVAAGPRVTFPNGHVVAVEIAFDDETRAQGLMYRDRIREGTGMLFLFPQDEVYSFWMKNTIIPLDMIWIATDGTVVDVKSHVPPCQGDPCPNYTPAGKARYVLEVGAGVAGQQSLTRGSRVRIEGIERYVAR